MMRKRNWKSAHPSSLSEAMELCVEFAAERRRPIKVLADLMGIENKTLYRWLAETSMPLNRIRQFEEFCGIALISEYLCLAQGSRVVIEIPTGKKADVGEVSEVQANAAAAIALLAKFYVNGQDAEATLAAMTCTLTEFAFHRHNVAKAGAPELDFGSQS